MRVCVRVCLCFVCVQPCGGLTLGSPDAVLDTHEVHLGNDTKGLEKGSHLLDGRGPAEHAHVQLVLRLLLGRLHASVADDELALVVLKAALHVQGLDGSVSLLLALEGDECAACCPECAGWVG